MMIGIKIPERCPECNELVVFCGEWFVTYKNLSSVPDGQLRVQDVSAYFVLGCDDCSADIITVPASDIAKSLTDSGVSP